MRFAVFSGDTLVGHSALEFGDPPMGVAFGKFIPTEGYRLIQDECRMIHTDQAALALTARTSAGDKLPCSGVSVLDYAAHADVGDEPYVEATVLGIPDPLYGELFPAHVAAYEKQFRGG
ncbi:MAG TPA: hypothetical protein VF453_09555 [Burkholderiaceae bacterium]